MLNMERHALRCNDVLNGSEQSLGSLGSPPAEATLRSKNCSASERWKSRSSSLVTGGRCTDMHSVYMLLDILVYSWWFGT